MTSHPILSKPHFITNLQGKTLSCHNLGELAHIEFQSLVNGKGEKIGLLKCLPEDRNSFFAFFYSDNPDFQILEYLWRKKTEEILCKDLEGILYNASQEPLKIAEVLNKCCLLLRTYVIAENCSIFGLPEGTTLTGLMAVTPKGIRDENEIWNYISMNIASIVIKEKQPYICDNPSTDPNFSKTNDDIPKNLVCFPILNEGTPIGVMQLSNKIGGPFNESDLNIIHKFSTVISHLLREEFERKQSEKFRNTSDNLGKYLSGSVVRKIATTGTSGEMGGVTKKVVVLFSDIRSFTTITEGISAPLLVNLLNFYFEEMSAVIERYEGTVDKLVGDLMMVLWNTPNEQADPEVLATKCALEMQKISAKIVAPKWLENGVDKFGIGIGINSGEAVAGNMGSSRFRNYTVIGNCINLAQRLEARAKAGEIWVYESMYQLIAGKVIQPVRVEKNLQLKGLHTPVNAYVFRAPV